MDCTFSDDDFKSVLFQHVEVMLKQVTNLL